MCTKTASFFMLLILSAYSKNVRHRVPRFIGGSYTSTVTSTQVITSLVPSSCVFVDPTLSLCRGVRFLSFPHFDYIRKLFNNETAPFRARSDKTDTTALGWGEYFGIYQPTVTVTQIELQTSIVQDPRVAVTYAVKGCRPLKLPSDIDRCEVQASSTISILEILPTTTVAVPQATSLSRINHEDFFAKNKISTLSSSLDTVETTIKNIPVVESSTIEENPSFHLPTQPLHF